MRLVQKTGSLEPQFLEIVKNALDRRMVAEVTSPGTADTEFSVTHGLGAIPSGFLVVKQDKAAVTYESGTAWTVEKIFLKTNVATVALKILIF